MNPFSREFVLPARRSLETKRLQRLAFCLVGVPFNDEVYTPFLNGIMDECQNQQFQLSVQTLQLSSDGEVILPPALRDGNPDGIILSGFVNDDAVVFLQKAGIPFVVLGNYELKTPVVSVRIDLRRAGALIAGQLLDRGHREIAFVMVTLKHAYERELLDGVREAHALCGVPFSYANLLSKGGAFTPPLPFLEPFLKRNPRPTALVIANTSAADGWLTELCAAQIKVPEEVEIVSLVSTASAPRNPRYNVLNIGLERSGRLAVKRLAEMADSSPIGPSVSVLPPLDWLKANGQKQVAG